MPRELARAKINITLHVGRVIQEQSDPYCGYHPLDSLVVFSDFGDELTCEPSDKTTLNISGPFASNLETNEDNLILKAYRRVQREISVPDLSFSLVKNLPVAAGIGGGSANAAAVLRLLQHHVDICDESLHQIALSIGADVPVCLASQTSRMTGIGETVSNIGGLGQAYAVLINPGVQLLTRDIFNHFDKAEPRGTPRPQKIEGSLLNRAKDGRNDLEKAAISLEPVIQDVLTSLSLEEGCELARMSGSGATCFGVFNTSNLADLAAKSILTLHPDWWVKACVLGEI